MACPICDNKPLNCDCTELERRQHEEIEWLTAELERHRMTAEERAYADRVVGYMHAFGPSDARELEGYLKRTAPEAK